jgi:DNA-binding IscR family transcriptional regulator
VTIPLRAAQWVDLQNVILDYLKAITVADLAKSQEAKQRALARRAKRRAAAFGLRS